MILILPAKTSVRVNINANTRTSIMPLHWYCILWHSSLQAAMAARRLNSRSQVPQSAFRVRFMQTFAETARGGGVNAERNDMQCAIALRVALSLSLVGRRWLWKLGGHTNTYKKLKAPMVKIKDFTISSKNLGGGHVPPAIHNFLPCFCSIAARRYCQWIGIVYWPSYWLGLNFP